MARYIHGPIRLVVVALLILGVAGPAAAQLPDLSGLAEEAQKALQKENGSAAAQRAQVMLNNRVLFYVYGADKTQAQERADMVNLRLRRVLESLPTRAELPEATVARIGGQSVVLLDGRPLLTVTAAAEAATDKAGPQLASEWATEIEFALAEAQREQRPEYLRDAALRAGVVLLLGVLLHLGISFLARKLLGQPGWPVLLLVWIGVISRILDLFPQTRPLRNLLREGVFRPVFIFIVVALAALALSRALGLILNHFFPPLPETLSPEERTERTFRRRATLGEVARVTGITVIWIVAGLVALSWAGVNLPALLASAGLIGVAIGLAAQDTMKDIVAGINILMDDRYGVGDVIQVGSYTGTVENLNLRITQIRDLSGRLITFPNRQIETVANMTSRWAQVDFKVGVAYDTDLRRALRVMETTAWELAQEWPERILAEPEILGADAYNDSDITLRMLVRTTPGDQWPVARELRLRIKDAFDQAGITIPFPQRTLWFAGGDGDGAAEDGGAKERDRALSRREAGR